MDDEVLVRERILALSPYDVAAYLRAHRWVGVPDADDRAQVFTYRGDGVYVGAEVLVPLASSLADYGMRMTETLQTLAHVEARSLPAVLDDLRSTGVDTYRFRWIDPNLPPGEIPLLSAARLMDGVREMMATAALSAVSPRSFYAQGRHPAEVSQFLREAHVTAAHAGSYVITVTSAVPPRMPLAHSAAAPGNEEDAFGRRAMTRLATGLQALESLLRALATGETLPDLTPYIANGLNANLCDALINMLTEGAQQIEATASWSPLNPPRDPIPARVLVAQKSREWIEAVGTTLKQRAVTDDFELHGIVVRLERKPRTAKAVPVAPSAS
jgi:hypothetical protein